jgi:aldose 1-epimerase
VGGWLG